MSALEIFINGMRHVSLGWRSFIRNDAEELLYGGGLRCLVNKVSRCLFVSERKTIFEK